MLIFDKYYNSIISNCIVPLSSYGVSYSDLRKDAIKSLLYSAPIQIVAQSPCEAIFFFRKDQLLKALNNDVMLFFIRTMLQRDAAIQSPISSSTNWSIVTEYYYAFYLANLLLRLCFRGTMFLDDDTKHKIHEAVYAFTNSYSNIGNNCFFEINLNEQDAEFSIKIASSNSLKTHELLWDQVDKLFYSLQNKTVPSSDEYTILKMIELLNKKLGSSFPSRFRNKINYQPYYGVKEIEKTYPCFDLFSDRSTWLTPILSYQGQRDDTDPFNVSIISAYFRYIQELTFCLINEYADQRGRGSKILSSINKNREVKLSMPEASPLYM